MSLDLFTLSRNTSIDDCHEKFKFLNENKLMLSSEIKILESWTDNFEDRDNKIVREFQTTFHSSIWEFYLNAYFHHNRFSFLGGYERPDFIVSKSEKYYVEAVTANIRKEIRQEKERTFEDQLSMLTPPWRIDHFQDDMNEAIVRNSSVIYKKKEKYKNDYSIKCDWIDKTKPYIIAIASYDQVNYGREYVYSILALLYGYYFDAKKKTYTYKDRIEKPNNTELPLNIFNMDDYQDVSAIMFSCTISLGKLTALAISNSLPTFNCVYNIRENMSGEGPKYQLQIVSPTNPEILEDGVFIFHNPKAKNPINFEDFPTATHFFCDDDGIKIAGNETPIVGRLNIPFFQAVKLIPEIQEKLRLYNDLSKEEFYET